ncbi:uncharacterized protein BCR38DRAFT_47953 [Pseudomassariella vexata]|uniref:Uncharacterized protein n=1 Tax=Pseudomassariella vexata TaxID=1141098 RepID=A0A1Y2DNJ9_9PEZI|nr:uncharacterized protein BCR38DRAFT_47953 [Pseudomassariella vexata]ORY60852.1 hypothetical protein BCR38DRAFT_47953 [Pseudomassariella vexata]
MILSGACAALATINILVLMFRHATHFSFSRSKEQAESVSFLRSTTCRILTTRSRTLKICAFIPIYSIGSWICISAPEAHVYRQPWLDTAQAFALSYFLLLFCHLLANPSNKQ